MSRNPPEASEPEPESESALTKTVSPLNSRNIGFHTYIPFQVFCEATYNFRFHADYGTGGYIGFNGVTHAADLEGEMYNNNHNMNNIWGYVFFEPQSLAVGDHYFEALGFEGCCDGHAELEIQMPGGDTFVQVVAGPRNDLSGECLQPVTDPCPWVNLPPVDTPDTLQCMDGSYCNALTEGWGCCANKGNRARCPVPSAGAGPNMCATDNQCGGGTANCCENDCSCCGRGGNRPCPSAGMCSGSMDIASDNAYSLYINGAYQENVNGGRTNVAGCDTAKNQFNDPYTGCNWQSVDRHEFTVNGPLVIAVDALDAGGTGGWVGTLRVNGQTYPTNAGWRCWNSDTPDGQTGGWSQVNTGWHGDAPDLSGGTWFSPRYDDVAWQPAFEFGANGVGPWGDVNREMGAVDDGGLGTISADSQWIWSQDKDAHNDVFCRFTVPCGAEVLFSEDFQDSDAIGRWKGKGGAATPWSATIKSNGLGGQALMMNRCASGGDAYSDATVQCSIDTPCLVSYWSVGAPWQGFAEQFAGPHIWSATPTDYDGQHVTTPTSSDWQFTQYVFPGTGIDATNPAGDDETVFVHGGGEIGANPVRLMLESFSRTGECDTT